MLKSIEINDLKWDVFEWIGQRWMLVVGGTRDSYNMMTASWGGVGIVWNEPMVFVFVRPSRYTHEFLMKYPRFSLVFLPDSYREILNLCGSRSGRDIDKMRIPGITPVDLKEAVGFDEAELVIIARTAFRQPLDPSSLLREDVRQAFYSTGDYHDLFMGSIEGVWIQG
ncbi:flavin reductase family protein [Thermospira aquatica]|uniref:Flavin reductase n=1 Tax=Thermospira aquatica TaxID=2828656 RepID=A0AAX3BBR7_9SPIR|nr:flavin reductase [Thermospira aquatica]URA09763.1 flavin reductase [Thermospira aquatica]